ncbi:MAG: hypothetical protein H0Z31_12230 [Bacillus sp. (in: Bacteria)]|nr:hypothetical protein [Bacillus sp. (in: firmicutes)]
MPLFFRFHRIKRVLGKHQLNKITAAQCQEFINKLLDEGLSERYIEYIEYIYTVLYGALQKAIEWDLIICNPKRSPSPFRAFEHQNHWGYLCSCNRSNERINSTKI